MKYKDFKNMLSKDDMKKVMGGDPPLDWCFTCNGTGGYVYTCTYFGGEHIGEMYHVCVPTPNPPDSSCIYLKACSID